MLFRSHGGRLHVVAGATTQAASQAIGEWRGEKQLALPAFGGVLRMTPSRGKGISLKKIAGRRISVRARGGGERLRLDPKRPSRTLKNLWQEMDTPVWLRKQAPLLFAGDALVYVAGLGVDAAFSAAPGEASVFPDWRPQAV